MKIGINYALTTIETDEVRMTCKGESAKEYNIYFKDGQKTTFFCDSEGERDFELERLMRHVCERIDEEDYQP